MTNFLQIINKLNNALNINNKNNNILKFVALEHQFNKGEVLLIIPKGMHKLSLLTWLYIYTHNEEIKILGFAI